MDTSLYAMHLGLRPLRHPMDTGKGKEVMTDQPDQPDQPTNRPTFTASYDVRTLVLYLSECPVGKLITYQEMSGLIDKDVQTEARHILTSARKITQREHGIVFGTIPEEGLKRLSDYEIVQTGQDTVVKIRRASHRGVTRIAVAQPEKLSLEQRTQQNTYLSFLAMLHLASQEKRIKKLEAKVKEVQARLPLDTTLEAFKEKHKKNEESDSNT
jgi:hypothetical protein